MADHNKACAGSDTATKGAAPSQLGILDSPVAPKSFRSQPDKRLPPVPVFSYNVPVSGR